MKQKWMAIAIIVIIGWVILFPKPEETQWVHYSKPEVPSYQIELVGDFNLPRSFVFFEPKTVDELLSYGQGYRAHVDLSHLRRQDWVDQNRTFFISAESEKKMDVMIQININQANFKTLITIPHMTESRAAALIIYREAHGKFQSIDDLIHVKHIGTATLEKIRPYVTI